MPPKGQRWTPGMRPTGPHAAGTGIKKLLVTTAHSTSVHVGEATKSERGVAFELNAGITSEIQENDIVLTLAKKDQIYSVSLTNLREDELDAIKEAIDYAFDLARPIIQKRDQVAQEARNNGDNTYRRMHRGTPNVSYIRRPRGSDPEELRGGSSDVLSGPSEE